MPCCGCGSHFDFDTPGVIIKTISADISPKSGRPIPQEDFFPDGTAEKFLCANCLLEKSEVATLLGFYGTGFDFPTEEQPSESAHVFGMPTAYSLWTEGYKP